MPDELIPPETYYYATGSEITSIADAIRTKGGTNQSLEFPDDFVEAIENLEVQTNLKTLTVTPHTGSSGYTIKHIPGYTLVDYVRVLGLNVPAGYAFSVDLSDIHNGDTCYVKGILATDSGSGMLTDIQDMEGSFIWSSTNTYTKGPYTLTITATSVVFSKSDGQPYRYTGGDNNVFGYRIIGFAVADNTDGYSTVTVNPIPSNYRDTSSATATASDIIRSKTAYGPNGLMTGTLDIQHYYTGTSDPSSSLGANGDIYLKTS